MFSSEAQDLTKSLFGSFYSSDSFNPVLPSNFSRRHFRVKTVEGIWKKVPRKIRSKDELVKWINKLEGVDVYYSTSEWSDPRSISTKSELEFNPVSDNRLLSNDLVFDIDVDGAVSLDSLDDARKVTLNIYNAMTYFERYSLQYISFSGKKGFRISYEDKKTLIENPRERVISLEKDRKLFVEELKNLIEQNKKDQKAFLVKTLFDELITTNPLCVVRLLGTGHSTTKFISTEISKTVLEKPIKEILNHIPYIGEETPRIPQKREMTQETEVAGPRSRLSTNEGDASGVASSSPSFFYSNQVIGLKNCYIPIFSYSKGVKYLKEITDLQKKHSLGDLYVVEEKNKIHIISLKIMQYNQLKNLLLKTKCLNKQSFKKYKVSRVPLGCEEIKIIKGSLKGNVSKAHSELFGNEKGLLSGESIMNITMAGNPVGDD